MATLSIVCALKLAAPPVERVDLRHFESTSKKPNLFMSIINYLLGPSSLGNFFACCNDSQLPVQAAHLTSFPIMIHRYRVFQLPTDRDRLVPCGIKKAAWTQENERRSNTGGGVFPNPTKKQYSVTQALMVCVNHPHPSTLTGRRLALPMKRCRICQIIPVHRTI